MPFEAIELFNEIKRKRLLLPNDHQETNNDIIRANKIIYLSVISALAEFGDLFTSESLVNEIPASFLGDREIHGALIHMWVS